VRIEFADFDQFLDLDHGDPPGIGAQRVEVAGGFPVDQVAGPVRLPGLDQRQVGGNALFEDIVRVAEARRRLVLRQDRAVGGAGVEGGDAGPAGAQLFRQGALRGQFQFQLAAEKLLLEDGVLADIGGDHFPDLAGLQQQAEAEIVDPGIVADHGQVFDAAVAQGDYQVFGDAAQAEAARGHRHAVAGQSFQGLCGGGKDRFHVSVLFPLVVK